MRTRSVLLGIVATAVLAGCSQENDAQAQEPAATGVADLSDPALAPALGVVDAFYTALGERDCFTMRTLTATAFQQDDGYWADGCIDELQASVGDTYDYTVLSGAIDGQEADFEVQRDLPDGSTAIDAVVLIAVNGWVVESRSVDER